MEMKMVTLPMPYWPYGLIIEQSDQGILLRPKRKAREGWAKAFRQKKSPDNMADLRSLKNAFDADEWKW